MKYIVIIVILILNSCSGYDDRVKRPLNDLNYDDKEITIFKKQIKKEKKNILKKHVVKKEKKKLHKKKSNKKKKIINKINKKKQSKKKLVKSIKPDKSINIYKVKSINEYEEFLSVYSENSEYPNINN